MIKRLIKWFMDHVHVSANSTSFIFFTDSRDRTHVTHRIHDESILTVALTRPNIFLSSHSLSLSLWLGRSPPVGAPVDSARLLLLFIVIGAGLLLALSCR